MTVGNRTRGRRIQEKSSRREGGQRTGGPKSSESRTECLSIMSGRDDNWTTAIPSSREFEQRQAAGTGRTGGATGVVVSLEERKPEEDMR